MFKIFFPLALLFACHMLPMQSFCSSPDFDEYSEEQYSDTDSESYLEKVYVQPEQLHICQEGIFFLNKKGCLSPACAVFCDRGGVYILAKKYYQCPSCGWGNDNDRCINKRCPLYGQ